MTTPRKVKVRTIGEQPVDENKYLEDQQMCHLLDTIRPGERITYAIGGPGNWSAFRHAYALYLQGKVALFQQTDKPPPKGNEPLRSFHYIAVGLTPPFIPVVEVERT